MQKAAPKVDPEDKTYVGELEFDVAADKLIEAIRQRQERQGKDASRDTLLIIAQQILESRL